MFLQSDDFAHDVYALYGGVEAFAGVALLSHRQVLLSFVHTASEDGVGACTREILVFSRSIHRGTFLF